MINKKNIFGIVILLILIVNFSFVLAEEIEIKNEIVSFDSEKVDYIPFDNSIWGEDTGGFYFKKEGGFVEINGNRFENILSESKSLNPSYIIIDNKGNILQADLTANEKGSAFLINGLTLEAPPNSRVYYDKNGFYLEGKNEGIDILNINKEQFTNLPISGNRINFFDELFLESGKVSLQEEGYLVEGNFIYDKMEIAPKGLNKILIEKNPLTDLSNYKENFIQHTNNGLKIQSQEYALGFNLRFLEGNEIFDMPPQEGNKESFLSIDISDGDGLEITKKDYLIKGMPALIKHESSKEGQTIIKNGKHIFKFEDGKYLSELGNLNAKNKLSVNFNLESDILGTKTINIDDDNGYLIYEPKTGENIFTFDKTLLDKPNYNFESEIGKKVYSFAEEQVGNSAFVSEGRGKCYGTEAEKFPGFDCIGLGIASLKNAYPEEPLKNFPPNLKLVETLEKKGWKSLIIEPSEVVGEETAKNSVKNIPPGSIVFLMHSYDPDDYNEIEGVSYQKYLNSNGDEVFLNLGHTLIRGTGEKNFINAKPYIQDAELPLRARKINENLRKQGKEIIFSGGVREGEFIPEEDYLLIISPP